MEKNKAVMYDADISKRYFSVCHLKIVFYFLHELKQKGQGVVTSLDGINGRSIQTLLREVITTRSNRMKFRLTYGRKQKDRQTQLHENNSRSQVTFSA